MQQLQWQPGFARALQANIATHAVPPVQASASLSTGIYTVFRSDVRVLPA